MFRRPNPLTVALFALVGAAPACAEVYLLPNGTVVDTSRGRHGYHYLFNGTVELSARHREELDALIEAGNVEAFDTVEDAKRSSPECERFSSGCGGTDGGGGSAGVAASGRDTSSGYQGEPLVRPPPRGSGYDYQRGPGTAR